MCYDGIEKEQGPFTTTQMRGWYGAGHLEPSLRVRQASEATFVAISARVPPPVFITPPPLAAAPQPHPAAVAAAGAYGGAYGHHGGYYGAPTHGVPPHYGAHAAHGHHHQHHHHSITGHRPGVMPGQLGFAGHAYAPPPAGYDPNQAMAAQEVSSSYGRTVGFNARDGRMTQGSDGMSHWAKKGLPDDRAGRQMARFFDVNHWQGTHAYTTCTWPYMHKLYAYVHSCYVMHDNR